MTLWERNEITGGKTIACLWTVVQIINQINNQAAAYLLIPKMPYRNRQSKYKLLQILLITFEEIGKEDGELFPLALPVTWFHTHYHCKHKHNKKIVSGI